MSNVISHAATIYELADILVQLRFRAEVAWCSEGEGDGIPARVDAAVGRAFQYFDELLASPNAGSRAVSETFRDAIATAWKEYQQAWNGSKRREAVEWWQRTPADNDYEKRAYALSKSPLAAPAWQELERLTSEFCASLSDEERTCFQLSSLLADELYPTEHRERRVEKLDISELRYLTVELNHRVRQAVTALSATFAGLCNVDHDLSDFSEIEAISQIQLLHRSVLSCLNQDSTTALGAPPVRTKLSQSDARDFQVVKKDTSETPILGPVPLLDEDKMGPPAHGADFRSVYWFGKHYSFTTKQAACVEILWKHWQQKTPEVSGSFILNELNFNGDRLDHIFRNCTAWGTMIVKGETKGTVRLAPLQNP